MAKKRRRKVSLFANNYTRLVILFLFLYIVNGHFYIKYYENLEYIFKYVPIPALNCYSVPSTIWACPIGSIQHFFVIGSVSFLMFGFLLLLGSLIGRWSCGWICPFGFIQEWVYHIPSKKIKIPDWLKYGKYLFLIFTVILMPMFLTTSSGNTETYFCKICPSGCIGAGIPQVILHEDLRPLVGFMYWTKLAILSAVLIAAVFIKRPFCRIVCPLGAFFGITNKFSLLKLNFNETKCYHCNLCETHCPVDLNPSKEINSPECILCGNCTKERCGAITKIFTIEKERKK